jgi:hypothetical protein
MALASSDRASIQKKHIEVVVPRLRSKHVRLLDYEFRRFESEIWINQKIIEPCLAISMLTNQKVFSFNGVNLKGKFLDAEK